MIEFVERTEFISTILSKIERNIWCGIVGSRYSGKTVFARQLSEAISRKYKDWKVTLVEFNGPKGTLNDAWQQIETRIQSENSTSVLADQKGHLPADRLINILSESNKTHCLVLDNIRIFPDEVMQLLAAELKKLSQMDEYRPRLRCIVLGGMKLFMLAQGKSSPFAGVVEIERLPDLTFEQAIASFDKQHGIGCLEESAKEALFAETAGQPELLRKLAGIVNNGLLAQGKINEGIITGASKDLSSLCAKRKNPISDCYSDSVCFIEKYKRAFSVLLDLLEGHDCSENGPDDEAIMCGAFSSENGRLQFKGRFFERALRAYFDPLRKADYCCLHGNWDLARLYYEQVTANDKQMRRKVGFGHSKKRIMDLCLGLAPVYMGLGELKKAQEIITQTSKDLFGADLAILWRIKRSAQEAEIVNTTGKTLKSVEAKDVALFAARENLPFTLVQNKGIIQGIGSDPNVDRWALELQYEKGIPGQWVIDSLHYVQPLFANILNQAFSKETDIENTKKRRRLLREIALELQKSSELKHVFALIVDGVKEHLGYECAQLSLVFSDEKIIRAVKSNGTYDPDVNRMTIRDLNGPDILSIAIREKRAIIIDDCSAPESQCESEAIRLSGLHSQLIIPLIIGSEAIGTLQVGDTRKKRAFTEEDKELLGLFADQAAIAIKMTKEREALESALDSANTTIVSNTPNKFDYSKGNPNIEIMAWDFLLNITLKGGPGFNRAAIFLRRPQSDIFKGFLCHGASDLCEWKETVHEWTLDGNRREVIDLISREKSEGKLSEIEKRRIESLQSIVITPNNQEDLFSIVINNKKSAQVMDPGNKLGYFFEILGWEVPRTALTCPLIFRGDCEGFVYVDKAFSGPDILENDRRMLENLCIHLASMLHRYRLDEQLRFLVLGHTHTWLAPLTAISGLAETLKECTDEQKRMQFSNLIHAEAERGINQIRRVLFAGKLYSGKIQPIPESLELTALLKERINPYVVLIKAYKIKTDIDIPTTEIFVIADRALIGSAIAELAANALSALKAWHISNEQKVFYISCTTNPLSNKCEVVFENSGALLPEQLEDRIFDPFSSQKGSHGLGLWLVKESLKEFGGSIQYGTSKDSNPMFTIRLPLFIEDKKGVPV